MISWGKVREDLCPAEYFFQLMLVTFTHRFFFFLEKVIEGRIYYLQLFYSVGLMSRRTNEPSDQWAVGPMGRRTNGSSDQWAVGLMGRRIGRVA